MVHRHYSINRKSKSQLSLLDEVTLFFVLALLSFPNIFRVKSIIITVLLAFFFTLSLFHRYSIDGNFRTRYRTSLTFWFVFLIYVVLDRGPIGKSLKYIIWPANIFFLLTSAMLNEDRNKDVVIFCAKTLAVINIVNVAATIIFFLIPSLYAPFKKAFLREYLLIKGEGYKAGLTSHYSTNGMVLALGLLSSFSLLPTRQKIYKPLVALYLIAVLLTTKRAHLVFSVFSCAIVFVVSNGKQGLSKKVKYIFALLMLIVIAYVTIQYVPALGVVFSRLKDTEDEGRIAYWLICISLFNNSPVFGMGWKSFSDKLYGTSWGEILSRWGNMSQDAHNVFLQVLGEQGIIGEILLLGSIGTTLYTTVTLLKRYRSDVRQSRKKAQNDGLYVHSRFSLCIQIFCILYCLTGNPLYSSTMYIPWLLAMSICVNQDYAVRLGIKRRRTQSRIDF